RTGQQQSSGGGESPDPPQGRAVVAVVARSDEGVRPADGAGEWGGDFLGGADTSELLGGPVFPARVDAPVAAGGGANAVEEGHAEAASAFSYCSAQLRIVAPVTWTT